MGRICADIPSCRWGTTPVGPTTLHAKGQPTWFRSVSARSVPCWSRSASAWRWPPSRPSPRRRSALGTVVSANPANFTPNVASGAVHKFVQVGGTMYAGGAFSSVSTPAGVSPGGTFARGNIVAFNAATGVVSTTFAPSVNGEVWALASDGSSLWIGGTFTSVNGTARRGVAKLNPTTGAVDPAFNANLASGKVTELAAGRGPADRRRHLPGQSCGPSTRPPGPTPATSTCRSPAASPPTPGRSRCTASPSTRPGPGWSRWATSPRSAARPATGRSC